MSSDEPIQINATTRAIIEPDQGTEDPRSWDPASNAADGISLFVCDSNRGNANDNADSPYFHDMPWVNLFIRLYNEYDDDVALRAMRILSHFDGIDFIPPYMAMWTHTGYSQSDWSKALITGPTKEAAEGFAKTWDLWAQGDVWVMTIERLCSITDEWFEDAEDHALGGVYADYCETETEIPQAARDNFVIDDEPRISPWGQAQLDREAWIKKVENLHATYVSSVVANKTELIVPDAEALIQELTNGIPDVNLGALPDLDGKPSPA